MFEKLSNCYITFRITKDGEKTIRMANGRVAQTIAALVEKGAKGISAPEMLSSAYGLRTCVHILRHDYGVPIEILREPHDGVSHARYVLGCEIEVLELITA